MRRACWCAIRRSEVSQFHLLRQRLAKTTIWVKNSTARKEMSHVTNSTAFQIHLNLTLYRALNWQDPARVSGPHLIALALLRRDLLRRIF